MQRVRIDKDLTTDTVLHTQHDNRGLPIFSKTFKSAWLWSMTLNRGVGADTPSPQELSQ